MKTGWMLLVAMAVAACADPSSGSDASASGGDVGADGGGDVGALDTSGNDGGQGDVHDGGVEPSDAGPGDASGSDAASDTGPSDDAGDAGAQDAAADAGDTMGKDAQGGGLLDCCSVAAPCGPGLVCAPLPGDTGVCQEPTTGCWSNADCEAGFTCQGVTLCPCTADCAEPDAPGACVPDAIPEGCCATDEDCDMGTDSAWTCAGPSDGAGVYGTCVPYYGPAACWDDGDCPSGTTCDGATYCACGQLCGQIEKPGACVVKNQLLCDGWCEDPLMTCVGDTPPPAMDPSPGRCMMTPIPGRCWEDDGCEGDQVCVGAKWCAPGAFCLQWDLPGWCLEPATAGCWTAEDCDPQGTLCVGAAVAQDPENPTPQTTGVCCPTPPGGCWQDSHCPKGETCVGASLPLPDACADPLSGAEAGTCIPTSTWPEELCLSDADCATGVCYGEWTCPAGGRCIDGPYPGLCLSPGDGCFEIADCGGAACGSAYVCDVISGQMCGAIMAAPGACETLDAGDICLQGGGGCGDALSCCYPCGIPGCAWKCVPSCDPGDPFCSGGCSVGMP